MRRISAWKQLLAPCVAPGLREDEGNDRITS